RPPIWLKVPERASPPKRTRPGQLEAGHVGCLQTFGAGCYLKLDSLTFVQGLIAVGLNCGEMHENILAALALDKSITFAGVKPLHCSLFFHKTLLFTELL